MSESTNTEPITSRIRPSVADELRKYAQQDGISISRLIHRLAVKEVQRRHNEFAANVGGSNAS
jgi:molybdopterin-guanine dinucleotide biosynthesis protein A